MDARSKRVDRRTRMRVPRDVWRRALRFFSWLGRHELSMLVLMGVMAASVWAFVELADDVMEGDTHAVDEKILLAMRNPEDRSDPIGPRWAEEMGRDFTALGGTAVLTLITLTVVGYLLMVGRRRTTLFVAAAVIGGQILSSLLKIGFDRPRPDLVPHGSYTYTASFPSGHSMMSAVTYLTLGALLARVQPRWRIKAYILTVAILLTLLVGVSRVYVGVHWPSDVLAGWAAGTAWAVLMWSIALWLQRRGRVETAPLAPAPPADDGP